ncbi:hypothetical protein CK203_107974 [Vitis vinifera]|uniref:Uncharacterized protein n=1 Tax=Vitis vinifera TaxID=29760 RepID=A0A438BR00_VITVI|nr:hypothetical protein CK203_107974 [Vitis vinifera]
MASSSSLRPRNDNSNMDIAEHVMASSSSLQRTSSSEFDRLELYKAVLNGDWESTLRLLLLNPRLSCARFGTDDSPMLHIAVELGEARMGFVENLVNLMPSVALDLRDSDGATALFNAVRAGNIKAAKLLVNKKLDLPNICNKGKLVPLHSALRHGHKELTLYLLSVTSDPSPFAGEPGFKLLSRALMVGFHDVALCLVQRYPNLVTCHFDSAPHDDANDSEVPHVNDAPLTVLAKRPWAFPSGSRFNLWQLIIYHC